MANALRLAAAYQNFSLLSCRFPLHSQKFVLSNSSGMRGATKASRDKEIFLGGG
jgi:hypothetical protein